MEQWISEAAFVLLDVPLAVFFGTRLMAPQLAELSPRLVFRHGTHFASFFALVYSGVRYARESGQPPDTTAGTQALWMVGFLALLYGSALWRVRQLWKKADRNTSIGPTLRQLDALASRLNSPEHSLVGQHSAQEAGVAAPQPGF